MLAIIVQLLAGVTVKLSEKDTDVVKLDGTQASCKALTAAVDSYATAYEAVNRAHRELTLAMSTVYPKTGPLAPMFADLDGDSTPWSEPVVHASLDSLRSTLCGPVEGLAGMAGRLVECVALRDASGTEREHYVAKVGKLSAEAAAAAESKKPAAKQKLADNQAKLSAVMEAHAGLSRRVTAGTAAFDPDCIAVLTPVMIQAWRGIAQAHSEAASAITAALDKVPKTADHRAVVPRPPPALLSARAERFQPKPGVAPPPAAGGGPGQSGTVAPVTVPAAALAAHPAAPSQAARPPQPVVLARVDAAYTAESEGDLSLSVGDVVMVTKADAEGGGWWEARCGDSTGLCPSNYLQLLRLDGAPIPGPLDLAPGGPWEGVSALLPPGGWNAVPMLRTEGAVAMQAAYAHSPGADDATELPLTPGQSVLVLADTQSTNAGDSVQTGWVLALTHQTGRGDTGGEDVRVGFVARNFLLKAQGQPQAALTSKPQPRQEKRVAAPAIPAPVPVPVPPAAVRTQSIPPLPVPSAQWSSSPRYAPYARLLSLGMPRDAVRAKMSLEGLDTRVLDEMEGASPASAAGITAAVANRAGPPLAAAPPAPQTQAQAGPAEPKKRVAGTTTTTTQHVAVPSQRTPTPVQTPTPTLPAAATPVAILEGIQGFNKAALRKSSTASVTKAAVVPATSIPSTRGPSGTTPTRPMSMMDELKAKSAAKKS